MSKLFYYVFVCGLLACVTSLGVFAGNTGKIVGKATDAKTGEPLPGVNILVLGTQRGANTEYDGKYTIIGIPIGRYTVRASIIGYQAVEVREVKVGADETTPLDFSLTSTEVEMQTVIIEANKNLVNSFTTSSTKTVSSQAIEQIPNVKEVQDVMALQAGVVKQGNNIFLRGGRANEVQYLVDGIPTNSLMSTSEVSTGALNQQISNLQAGMASGVIGGSGGLVVSANSIQSVSVQTSGFDADYGNAQSGIVNIVTKSGGDKYTSSVQYRTDKLQSSNQNEAYTAFSLGGPEPITKYLLPSMGVTVPGALTIFFNTDVDRADGAYRYVHNDFYNPVERKVQLSGFLGGFLNGLGFTYRDDQKNTFTFNTKVRYDLSDKDQFFYSYRVSLSSSDPYVQGWKYLADSSGLTATISSQNVVSWTHFFGTNSFIRLNLGKVEEHDGNDVAGLSPAQYSIAINQLDPLGTGFNYLGQDQYWSSLLTNVWTLRLDLNSQVHPLHLLKAGFEVNYEQINSTQIQDPTQPTTINGVLVYPPFPDTSAAGQERSRGLYPYYGEYRYVFNNYPNHGAFYLQDNIEFSGLNLHVGLRYDYFDIGRQVYYNEFIQDWERDVNGKLPPQSQIPAEWVTNQGTEQRTVDGVTSSYVRDGYFLNDENRFLYYLSHGWFSPRLSIGYPVTDRIVFYFNYGHFLQYPDRDEYFQDPSTLVQNGLVGNPGLKPQRTVAYESGFEDQFNDEMSFGLHAFYKDIFDYPEAFQPTGAVMQIYKNYDYASSRGFEVTLSQALTGNLSANVAYTYQVAKGRSSSPIASIFDPATQTLPRETRLPWDQTHTANVFAQYKVGPRDEAKLFGLPFINNYGLSLTWSIGSGLPYTPYVRQFTARNVYLYNDATSPYTSTLNVSVYKGFYVLNKVNVLLTLDVLNVLNRQNVVSLTQSTGFNTQYGRPYQYGDYDPNTNQIFQWNTMDARVPPYVFDSPRQILVGVRLNWE